jgi:hypothetical protein
MYDFGLKDIILFMDANLWHGPIFQAQAPT